MENGPTRILGPLMTHLMKAGATLMPLYDQVAVGFQVVHHWLSCSPNIVASGTKEVFRH
jgi:hypothetical protein